MPSFISEDNSAKDKLDDQMENSQQIEPETVSLEPSSTDTPPLEPQNDYLPPLDTTEVPEVASKSDVQDTVEHYIEASQDFVRCRKKYCTLTWFI